MASQTSTSSILQEHLQNNFSSLDVFIFFSKMPVHCLQILYTPQNLEVPEWTECCEFLTLQSCHTVLNSMSHLLLSRAPMQKCLVLMPIREFTKFSLFISICHFLELKHKRLGSGEQHHDVFGTFYFFPSASSRMFFFLHNNVSK